MQCAGPLFAVAAILVVLILMLVLLLAFSAGT